jgi:hypothetical protein
VNTAFSRGASAALIVLCIVPPASAQSLAGVVIDPQRRIIVDARVTATCAGEPTVLETDAHGRFVFVVPAGIAGADCRLTVTYPGFLPFEQTLAAAQKTVTVQLQLADVKYAITVSPGEADRATLETVSIPDTVLGTISNRTSDLIDYARSVAGATGGDMRVYVDGLPARSLPAADAVRSVTINANPFSAEFADGDETRVDIVTKAPDRSFHFGFSGGSLGVGGQSVLASGLRSASRSYDGFVSGAVPRLPLTFAVRGRRGMDEHEEPVQAVVPSVGPLSPVLVRSAVHSGSFRVDYFKSSDTRASMTYDRGGTTGSNLGAGGLTLSEAGLQLRGQVQELRGTFAKAASRFLYESGLAVTRASSGLLANSAERGIEVVGEFISGGALITEQASRETSWTFRNVVQVSAFNQAWRYGATVSGSRSAADLRPNSAGSIVFSDTTAYAAALDGAPTGTRILLAGSGRVDYSSRTAGAFIQSERELGTGRIAGGLRGDYQTGGHLLVSPRVSTTIRLGRFVTRGGAGLFVTPSPDSLFLQVRQNDGSRFQRFVTAGSTLAGVASPPAAGAGSVTSVLSTDFTLARSRMASGSIERQIGRVTSAVQYAWTDRSHLSGSRRLPSGDRWIDVVESNRASQKHQVHALLKVGTESRNVLGHYVWTRSHDNTSGPFSYAERTDDLAREWARSTGLPPHSVILVASLGTTGGVAITVVAAMSGAVPYDITTGTDSDLNGLFNERGGWARNAGDGPDFRSIDLHASRTVSIPGRFIGLRDPLKLNAGLQAENLLGRSNYATVDSIAGSRLFGAPLAGLSGRSVRIWLNWAR